MHLEKLRYKLVRKLALEFLMLLSDRIGNQTPFFLQHPLSQPACHSRSQVSGCLKTRNDFHSHMVSDDCPFFTVTALLTGVRCRGTGRSLQRGLAGEFPPRSCVDSADRNERHLRKGEALKLPIWLAFSAFLTFS